MRSIKFLHFFKLEVEDCSYNFKSVPLILEESLSDGGQRIRNRAGWLTALVLHCIGAGFEVRLVNATLPCRPSRTLDGELCLGGEIDQFDGCPAVALGTVRGLRRIASCHNVVCRVDGILRTPKLGVVECIVSCSLESHIELLGSNCGSSAASNDEGKKRNKKDVTHLFFPLV